MAERMSGRKNSVNSNKKNDNEFVSKSIIQSVTALMIFLIVWGMSVCHYPKISEVCGKIKHYLTYTYDVQSVFNNFYNKTEVNDDTH